MINPLLTKGRFLFIVSGCSMCAIWKVFIDEFNMELKVDKQINVIDCTDFYSFGVEVDPVFNLFKKYIQGHFPMLFIEGSFKYGTTTVAEAKAWLAGRLNSDFLFRQNNPELQGECMYIESGKLKGKIICN